MNTCKVCIKYKEALWRRAQTGEDVKGFDKLMTEYTTHLFSDYHDKQHR